VEGAHACLARRHQRACDLLVTTCVERRFRSVDGVQIVGDEAGPAGAPLVVLLHGGGQTRYSWSGAVRGLVDRGYRVFGFDARGHGDSDWSPSGAYELDDRVNDLAAVLSDVSVSYALVGASLGGATAIHAVARGLTPSALVLVDIVPQPEPVGVERIVAFMTARPDGFTTLEEAVDAVAAYNPARARPRDPAGLLRNLREGQDGRLRWHWDPRITHLDRDDHYREVQRSARVLADKPGIPVLLVRGMQSDVVSEAGVEAFKAMMPRLDVARVGGAAHMVAGDRNDAFNASAIEFLSRHLPAAVAA